MLKVVCTPVCCFHVSLERHFEYAQNVGEKEPCGKYCSYCTGGHDEFARRIQKDKLLSVLFSSCFDGKQPDTDAFLSCIKKARNEIYEPGDIPTNLVGPIHGLCLQLLATGIIDLGLSPDGKLNAGSDKLDAKMVTVQLGMKNTGGTPMPAFMDDASWRGIKFARPERLALQQKYSVFSKLKVNELKDKLREVGLPLAGKKADLVLRLDAYFADKTETGLDTRIDR
jgi:hypothetical protein